MQHRKPFLTLAALAAIVVSACGGGAGAAAPSAAAPSTPAATASAAPDQRRRARRSPSGPTAVGDGEGSLNLIAWAGYVVGGTGGEQVEGYDWVTPFETATRLQGRPSRSASTRPTWSS